ncbi:MAG: tetratricopeptide repeat protein [Sphingomonas sp.]
MKLLLPLAMLMLGILPAQASWHVAETPRVVVRSRMPPAELERLVADIEQFDALLRLMTGRSPTDTVPRAEIVIFDSIAEVRATTGILGFEGGIAAATPMGGVAYVAPNPNAGVPIRQILFHEYAHLFMLAHMGGIQPGWFMEGFASFFETATPTADGAMSLGVNPNWQDYVRTHGVPPFQRVMTLDARRVDGPPSPELYALGWLMTHYYYFSDSRRTQIRTYLDLFARGALPEDGSTQFIGGFAALNADLQGYAKSGLGAARAVPVSAAADGKPSLRPLRAGETELMLLMMHPAARASAKSDGAGAHIARLEDLFGKLELIAQQYPDEIEIGRVAAQVTVSSGDYDRLASALDGMLRTNPKHPTLLAAQGIALTGQAEAGTDADFANGIARARRVIEQALTIDPRNTLALYAMYRNHRADAGVTRAAIAYLARAQEIEPGVPFIQWSLIDAYVRLGDRAPARALLTRIAANTHDPESSIHARAILTRIGSAQPR